MSSTKLVLPFIDFRTSFVAHFIVESSVFDERSGVCVVQFRHSIHGDSCEEKNEEKSVRLIETRSHYPKIIESFTYET